MTPRSIGSGSYNFGQLRSFFSLLEPVTALNADRYLPPPCGHLHRRLKQQLALILALVLASAQAGRGTRNCLPLEHSCAAVIKNIEFGVEQANRHNLQINEIKASALAQKRRAGNRRKFRRHNSYYGQL